MPTIEQSDALQLHTIHKHYRNDGVDTHALRGVSLTVPRGDFVAIMGRSGSGKSSLMNIIGLLDHGYEGRYEIDGEDIRQLGDSAQSELRGQKIGFVFQQFNLMKRATVLENVLLPTVYASRSDDELRALKIIKQVGLEKFVAHRSNQLSGGQIQRVAIARALIMEPTILLADEPTGNLDSTTAHEVMGLFRAINEAGTTIVLITHEDDIAAYAKRTIRLKDGKIEEER